MSKLHIFMFVLGIITASFFDPVYLASIEQVTYDFLMVICDISRALLSFIIDLFTGTNDV